jgi:hypothetical protein
MFPKLLFTSAVLVAFLTAFSWSSQPSADLYVSTIGKDSNPGTVDLPVKTIQRAADLAKPGSTIHVADGIYCEKVRVRTGGSQQGGFVTFESELTHKSILDGSCLDLAPEHNAMFELADVSFVRVKGFEIRNLRTSDPENVPWGIRVVGSGSHIEILQNDVHHIEQNFKVTADQHANGFGIGIYGTSAKTPISDLVVDGNEVHHLKTGNSESLVVNGNVSGFRITKNIVHDNSNIGIDVIGFEHTAPDPTVDRARDGVVSENTVYDITSRGYLGNEPNSDGIYVDGGTRILIERNIVHDVDYGIEMASEHLDGDTSHVIARNNLVYSCHASGFAIGGYDLKRGRTEDVIIVNNTIYKNDTAGTGGGEFLMQFYMSRNVFKNNIVVVGEHGKLMMSRSGPSDGMPTVSVDHNVYFFEKGKAVNGSFDAKEFSNFDQYLTNSGNDAHSIFADPGFVDPRSGNFHLHPSSPARNRGEDLGTDIVGSHDLNGRSRLTTRQIDAGCYQTQH